MAKSLLTKAQDPRLPPTVTVPGDDPFAPHLLEDYAARCQETGREAEAAQARKDAASVRAWQAANQKGKP